MINTFRLSIGKNLADLFINQQEYCLEKFKYFREEMSAHLNYEIKPIHVSDDERLKDNIVLLVNKDDENEIYQFEFNNDLEGELDLLLITIMYLYKTIYEEECKEDD